MVFHKSWKELRWRMTEGDAADWADKNGCDIERIEGSGETVGGKYLGFDGPSAPMLTRPDKRNS